MKTLEIEGKIILQINLEEMCVLPPSHNRESLRLLKQNLYIFNGKNWGMREGVPKLDQKICCHCSGDFQEVGLFEGCDIFE